MAFVPFIIGLLVGSPMIARELENRTAQTTWWLHPSRTLWLGRQLLVVGPPLLAAVVFAAITSDLFAGLDYAWGQSAFRLLGDHGPLVAAKGTAAFGVGLLAGLIIGRTVPTLVIAAGAMIALSIAVSLARGAWLHSLPSAPIGESSAENEEIVMEARAIAVGWGWRGPDGSIVDHEVPGYEALILGVSDQTAMGWETIELGLYAFVFLGSIGPTFVLIERRRPT
jgi:hypothetical protein